jgi:plasmid stabilization system protein ParE
MQYNIVLKPDASADITSIVAWYEEEKDGLGTAFLVSLDNLLSILKIIPFAFREVFLTYRRAYLSKFPYSVFNAINEKQKIVIVYLVMHNHLNPGLIKKRMK